MSIDVPLSRLLAERCVLVGGESPGSGRPYEIIVALDEADVPHAYRNECMHIAIPLGLFPDSILDRGSLLCATHGARYRIDDGYCFEGPCLGQTLESCRLRVEGEVVRVEP